MSTCYLVVFLNSKSLKAEGCGIYSESALTLTYPLARAVAADVVHTVGRDYAEARRRMVDLLATNMGMTLRVLVPLLDEGDRREIKARGAEFALLT
jgi:hypothetical protein